MPKKIYNKTKLIATIGPASKSYDVLFELIQCGVDVCRINFSHGTHADHLEVIQNIRKINAENNSHVAILGDLQGPKIRLGNILAGQIEIVDGQSIIMTSESVESTSEKLSITYPELADDVQPGERLLIDDGKLELHCIEKLNSKEIRCKVISGGTVKPRKGVNLPDTKISQASMTEKDHEDLKFALENDLEWIALSFVRTADEIIALKKLIKDFKQDTKVIAKIEKPEALTNINEIIEVTDAIMVARGDLGVEVPIEKLPFIQKDLVRKCVRRSKPVIIATHIMESMIEEASPTRAEVNDVANSMLDGADALMLSAETASGKHPVKVVQLITRIMKEMEDKDHIYNKHQQPHPNSKTFLSDAICYNACKIAEDVQAKAIIGMTRSGYTAYMTSSYRPKADIFIFSDKKKMLQTMSLLFGVRTLYYNKFVSTDETILDLHEILKQKGLLNEGDIVINLASMPIQKEGRTNMLKISKV